MALPIVSLPTETWKWQDPPNSTNVYRYKWRQRSKQAKPYNLPSNFGVADARVVNWAVGSSGYTRQDAVFSPYGGRAFHFGDYTLSPPNADYRWFTDIEADALNQASARFQALAVDETAELGTTLGEAREGISMISQRLIQLYKGFNSLKRLRFYDAAVAFGLIRKQRPKKRRVGKNRKLYWAKHPVHKTWYPRPRSRGAARIRGFASLVLEYNFGWAPLVKDIQATIKVLERDPEWDIPVRGSAKATGAKTFASGAGTGYTYTYAHRVTVTARMVGTYRVSNPNKDLAFRLGLSNLALVALELTPFSFVANWLVNLNEWVGNFDSSFRNSIVLPYWSVKTDCTVTATVKRDSTGRVESLFTARSVGFGRAGGSHPLVVFKLRKRFMPSWTRAINASSLLVVLFAGKRV